MRVTQCSDESCDTGTWYWGTKYYPKVSCLGKVPGDVPGSRYLCKIAGVS